MKLQDILLELLMLGVDQERLRQYGEDIIDEFDPNSRSLLTARNTYSGIMTFDHVLFFRKS